MVFWGKIRIAFWDVIMVEFRCLAGVGLGDEAALGFRCKVK